MNLEQEKKIWERGFNKIAGLDEAGRGPIAGPVTAAAVVAKKANWEVPNCLRNVKDSKQMNKKERERIYKTLISHKDLEWATSRVGSTVIDRINILEASKLAMKRAVSNLNKKLNEEIDFLMIDGNFQINSSLNQQSFIGGDQKVFLIAAASIIAKVSRDRAMDRYHKKFSTYRFDKHKGYPTAFHKQKVKKEGPCKIHRRSFKPVKNVIK